MAFLRSRPDRSLAMQRNLSKTATVVSDCRIRFRGNRSRISVVWHFHKFYWTMLSFQVKLPFQNWFGLVALFCRQNIVDGLTQKSETAQEGTELTTTGGGLSMYALASPRWFNILVWTLCSSWPNTNSRKGLVQCEFYARKIKCKTQLCSLGNCTSFSVDVAHTSGLGLTWPEGTT